MPAIHPPLVSIAIPLYRSAPWLRNVLQNIANIEYSNVEIIVSDRHCADDALTALEQQLREDPRMTFLRATDGLTWVEHYNELLRLSRGVYFMWMPHDDIYPADYVDRLVAQLECNRDSIGAFGRLEAFGEDGRPVLHLQHPKMYQGRHSRAETAWRWLLFSDIFVPVRGLFRREQLVAAKLFFRPTLDDVWADIYWIFGVALHGNVDYVPGCFCQKRYHAQSASAQWRIRPRHVIDGFRVVRGYWRDYGTGHFMGTAALYAMTGVRLLLQVFPFFRPLMKRLQRFF